MVFRLLLCMTTLSVWESNFSSSATFLTYFYSKGYTLLINTWKRYDLLKQSISHYTSCPGLDSIHVVWSEPDPPSDFLVKFLNHAAKSNAKDGRYIELAFDINKEDSLNNRFKELKNPITDAVFSIDDDIIFSCSTVEFAYSVWRSAPDTMVGFVPRIHLINPSVCLWCIILTLTCHLLEILGILLFVRRNISMSDKYIQ